MIRARTALALAAWLTASTVVAQDSATTPAVTLIPANPLRWDAATHVTWLGERLLDQSFDWDRWYEVASGGVSIGYYRTSHLKGELDVSASTKGQSYSIDLLPVPGPVPFLRQRDHQFRMMTVSAGLNYQFFENAWFHPFVGSGIELLRERERNETTVPFVSTRDPRAPAVIAALETETRVRYGARPFVAGGFKAYMSERAFIRSEVRTSWSSEGVAALAWRSGVGVDF